MSLPLLLLVGVGGYFLLTKDKSKKYTNKKEASTQEPKPNNGQTKSLPKIDPVQAKKNYKNELNQLGLYKFNEPLDLALIESEVHPNIFLAWKGYKEPVHIPLDLQFSVWLFIQEYIAENKNPDFVSIMDHIRNELDENNEIYIDWNSDTDEIENLREGFETLVDIANANFDYFNN